MPSPFCICMFQTACVLIVALPDWMEQLHFLKYQPTLSWTIVLSSCLLHIEVFRALAERIGKYPIWNSKKHSFFSRIPRITQPKLLGRNWGNNEFIIIEYYWTRNWMREDLYPTAGQESNRFPSDGIANVKIKARIPATLANMSHHV